jgi:PAS domain S-box-containing protein
MAGNRRNETNTNESLRGEIINKLSIGVVVLNVDDPCQAGSARIVEANPAAAAFVRVPLDDLRAKSLADIPQFSVPSFMKQISLVLRSQTPMDLGEVHLGLPGTRQGPYWLRAFPLFPNRICLTFETLAWRKPAEEGIRQSSDEPFRLLVHGVKDYAILLLDPEGRILSWNEGAERLQGYRSEEVIGKNYSIFFTPEDRESGRPEARLQAARAYGQTEEEAWRVRKDGSRFWVNAVITALRDEHDTLYGFAKVTRDITERTDREAAVRADRDELELRVRERTGELMRVNQKLQSEVRDRQRAEEQLRALAARLQRAQEAERVRLAREIHDALGQLCTALKMDITSLAQKLPKEERRLRGKAESALKLVGDLIKALRRLSTELRPSTLDALGLTAAMEWQAQEFQSHTAIRCQVHLPHEDLNLDPERSTALFRLFQESLTNVARHAHASLVQAELRVQGDALVLSVHDNGRGFNTSQFDGRSSLGFLGMKERVLLLGGKFELDSAPGKGTTLTFQIPLHPIAQVS